MKEQVKERKINLEKRLDGKFAEVATHVKDTAQALDCSGSSMFIIHKDKIVSEAYWGKHANRDNARRIQKDSQFHVASVRKSYIGFAVAYAVHYRYIDSIDDPLSKYLSVHNDVVTIRHLLTHSHGLNVKEGKVIQEFKSGENWAYRGINIHLLTEIVKKTTGRTVAQILEDEVFQPLGFKETGWYAEQKEKLVEVIRDEDDRFWSTEKETDGSQMNMYVSTRELAYWGYVHLKQGVIGGEQVIAKEIFQLATALQSPALKGDYPQNGFLWFVKDRAVEKTEIGERVPKGSYQILGYTNVAVLVIPKDETVAVRMYNRFGSTPDFAYLSNIRSFGDTVMKCLQA